MEVISALIKEAKRTTILFCSEVNSKDEFTSELANQNARKALFTGLVYTNVEYPEIADQSDCLKCQSRRVGKM